LNLARVKAKGHVYEIDAIPKSYTGRVKIKTKSGEFTRRHRGGQYIYLVWRDAPEGAIPNQQFYSKEAMYKAYPNLRGKLDNWP